MKKTLRIVMPIRTVSEANARDGWRAKAKRAQEQRAIAKMMLSAMLNATGKPRLPLRVTLTRMSSRKLDSDNLASALKAVRDGIADAIGEDDGSVLLMWRYEQGGKGSHPGGRGIGWPEVHVKIEEMSW